MDKFFLYFRLRKDVCLDTKIEEYILKIASAGNLTKAAAQLFITQPALTQQLQKLEQELGVPLFHRTKHEMKLTEAGSVYCSYAKKIVEARKEAYSIVSDMSMNLTGTLRIGLTRERGIDMFIHIFPEFYSRYPQVRIMPFELGATLQHTMLLNGDLDLGCAPLADKDKLPGFDYTTLCLESILLAIPRSHPIATEKANSPDEPFATINLSEFKNETFVLISQGSSLRTIIDPLFKAAGFEPDILFETTSNRTLLNITAAGLACSILPHNYATNRDKIAYFYMDGQPKWNINVICRKGQYLTRAAKYFIELAQDYLYEHAAAIN